MSSEDYDVAMICIGGKGHMGEEELRSMALAVSAVHREHPDAPITLVLDGYDDDPRSLWDIQEAADYVRRYAMASGLHNWRGALFQALDEETKALLIACRAVDEPHPYELELQA